MSSKGQIVIPKTIRDALSLTTGAEIKFERIGHMARLTVVRTKRTSDPKTGLGLAGYSGKPISLKQMELAIKKATRSAKK